MKKNMLLSKNLLYLLVVISWYSTTGHTPSLPPDPATASQSDQLYTYLWANYYHFKKEPKTAYELYYKTIEDLKAPVYAYKGFIHLLDETGNQEIIHKLLPKVGNSFDKDSDVSLIFARSFEMTGNVNAAMEKLLALNNQDKTHPEITFYTAQFYLRRKEPTNALKVIDILLNNSPKKANQFIFYFLKSQIYAGLQQPEKALDQIKICLELNPYFEKGLLFQALLEEQLGRFKQAINGYVHFLEIAGSNQNMEQHLLNLYFKQKMIEKNLPALNINQNCLKQSLIFFQQGNYKGGLEFMDTCLESTPLNEQESRLLKIQMLGSQHVYTTAIELLKQWIMDEPENNLWFDTLHLLSRQGCDIKNVITVLLDIEKKYPEKQLPVLYLADLFLRSGNQKQAHAYLIKALRRTSDTQLTIALMVQLAIHYYETKQFSALKEVSEQILELDAQQPTILNLLAYYYTTKEVDLLKAQELVQKALTVLPKNPHILDTQARIFIAQKNYPKAKELLEKIAHQEPFDPAINKHLAITLWHTGNHLLAKETLNKAINNTENTKKKNHYTQILHAWKEKQP